VSLVSVAALLFAVAAPVGAKKPDKPGPPASELVEVTLGLVGGQGLVSDCDDGDGVPGSIVMEKSGDELIPAFEDRLGLYIDGVDTSRRYPTPTASTGFSGCRGGDINGAPVEYGGLGVTLGANGAPTDILWHFDYYLETEQINQKRTRLTVMEHFTLSGHDLTFDESTSTVSGWFNIKYHLEEWGGESIGYIPVEGSPVFLSFTFEMQPQG
jgi:hypothetical protein